MKDHPELRPIKNPSVLANLLILVLVLSACDSFSSASHITPAPTPQCVEPKLTLGSLTFHIDTVVREADSFPEIPKRKGEAAFWVEGTTVNYIFGLSPTKDNLALDTVLKSGDPAVIHWADCSSDEYVVSSIDTAQPNDPAIFDQSSGGITVYVQDGKSALVIRGKRPVVESAETTEPANTTLQVDLSILEATESEDHKFVTFRLLITNQSGQTITLTENDMSLSAENAPEVFASLVEPTLPQDLRPGDILPVSVTFPKPSAPSAVLRIFDITFEYYF